MINRLDHITDAIGGRRGRWVTLAVWIVFVAALTAWLPSANDQKNDTLGNIPGDKASVQAARLLEREFPSNDGVPALLTWYRASGLTDEDLQGIQELSKRIAANPVPHQLSAVPLDRMQLNALKQQVSQDGTTFVQAGLFDKGASSDGLKDGLDELEMQADAVFDGQRPFKTALDDAASLAVRATGPVGISVDATGLFSDADVSLLIATVMLVLVFLLLIYRSPVLALIPLIAVGFAYGAITPLLGWMAKAGWIEYDSQALSIMTVLLFGAGTDYCLFLIARFRSELKETDGKFQALKQAFGGSAGAITMSGLTVVLALLVLLLGEYGSVQYAVPFGLAILVMMVASLTARSRLSCHPRQGFVLPLHPADARDGDQPRQEKRKTGEHRPKAVNARRSARRFRGAEAENRNDRLDGHIARLRHIRRPNQIHVRYVIFFPADMGSREGFTLIGEHFNAGELAPVQIVVQTEGKTAAVKETLASLPFVTKVSNGKEGVKDPGIQRYDVELTVNPYSNEAIDRIPDLRAAAEQALSQAQVSDASGSVWIGGRTAEQYDTRQTTSDDAKLIIPVVLILIALLLLVYLRSIPAMLYLIATVLLSYYGALGLGWIVLHYIFGADAIQGLIPLYAFVFIVALGEDYNIFMISSIWHKARRMPLRQAVKEGVAQTGCVITSAG